MTFEKFLEELNTELSKRVVDNETVVFQEVSKRNDTKLMSICIKKDGVDTFPLLYADNYYDLMNKNNLNICDIADKIVDIFNKNVLLFNSQNLVNNMMDFSVIKDRIIFQIINKSKNVEYLKGKPSKDFLDFAIIFKYLMENEEENNIEEKYLTVVINDNFFSKWGISLDELYNIALINTQKIFPSNITNMHDIIMEILGEIEIEKIDDMQYFERDEETSMYVLTNNAKIGGSSCLLYPNVLKEFAKNFNPPIYIIPSSIHEVIIVVSKYEDYVTAESLKDMVCEVNDTQVEDEEILSNNIYYYDKETDEISIVDIS